MPKLTFSLFLKISSLLIFEFVVLMLIQILKDYCSKCPPPLIVQNAPPGMAKKCQVAGSNPPLGKNFNLFGAKFHGWGMGVWGLGVRVLHFSLYRDE